MGTAGSPAESRTAHANAAGLASSLWTNFPVSAKITQAPSGGAGGLLFPANTPQPYEPPARPSRRDRAAPQHLQRPGRHPATPATGSCRHPRPGPPRSCHLSSPRAGNCSQLSAAPRPPRRRRSPARPWAGPDGAECWGSGGGRAGHGPSSCQRKREEGLGPALPSGEELGALPRGGSSPAEEGREGWREGAVVLRSSSLHHPLHPASSGAPWAELCLKPALLPLPPRHPPGSSPVGAGNIPRWAPGTSPGAAPQPPPAPQARGWTVASGLRRGRCRARGRLGARPWALLRTANTGWDDRGSEARHDCPCVAMASCTGGKRVWVLLWAFCSRSRSCRQVWVGVFYQVTSYERTQHQTVPCEVYIG